MANLLRRGDFVHVTFATRTIAAMVTLASPEALSLVIMFDGILGGYVGMMPIAWDQERRTYVDVLTGTEVVITPQVAERDVTAWPR